MLDPSLSTWGKRNPPSFIAATIFVRASKRSSPRYSSGTGRRRSG
jgi:hypothetical protein